ncbi:hypothetical protein Hanom_Chr17g01550251 [Helianthus anomalus]
MCKWFSVTYQCVFYIYAAELHMCKRFSVTYQCLFYICAVELHIYKLFTFIPMFELLTIMIYTCVKVYTSSYF